MINLKKPEYKEITVNNYDEITIELFKIIDTFPVCKNGNTKLNICPVGFDVETSTVEGADGIKHSYIWLNQLHVGGYNFIWRDYKIGVNLFNWLGFCCNRKYTVLVGIANMKYEMSFILRELLETCENQGMKHNELIPHSREPLTVQLGGLKFIDVCRIANGSLATIGKNYTTTKKLEGGLDYGVIRNKKTPIRKFELIYSLNDVVVIGEYMTYLHNEFTLKGEKFPLTSTGIPRNKMKSLAKEEPERVQQAKASYPQTYRGYIYDMTYLFRGGYVHGNNFYIGDKLENIACADYTSDYPACMIQELYPTVFYDFIKINDKVIYTEQMKSEQGLNALLKIKNTIAFKASITFNNIRSITTHSVESKNKCINENELIHGKNCYIDNGRVRKADTLKVYLTELDFYIYKKFYRWDSLTVDSLEVSKKERLPQYVLSVMLEQYGDKAQLKRDGKDKTPEYSMKKGILNSCYGVMVQRLNMSSFIPIIEDDDSFKQVEIKFNRKLFTEPETKDKRRLEKYNKRIIRTCKKVLKRIGQPDTDSNINIVKSVIDKQCWGIPLETNEFVLGGVVLDELQQSTYEMEINNNLFLSPYWGVWVTAYARHRILSMINDIEIEALKNDLEPQIVYSDTDSIYFRNPEMWLDKINDYNRETEEKNKSLGLSEFYWDLGQFDYNPKKDLYTSFKTLGAKRYIKTKGGETEATISGLKKNSFLKACNGRDPYEFFNNKMVVDQFTADKLASIYTDTYYSDTVVDYLGNSDTMEQYQGVELREVSFEMVVISTLLEKITRTERYL